MRGYVSGWSHVGHTYIARVIALGGGRVNRCGEWRRDPSSPASAKPRASPGRRPGLDARRQQRRGDDFGDGAARWGRLLSAAVGALALSLLRSVEQLGAELAEPSHRLLERRVDGAQ